MSLGTVILLVAGGLAAIALGWRRRTVGDVVDGPTRRMPATAVSVVVPARDEERTLPRLLASLAAQQDPAADVVVVDDGSTDATAAVAAAAGATVVTAPPPPPGWAGKPWACRQGIDATSAEVVVLLDADTWLAPDGLTHLVAAHAALAPDGLLSVQPHHHVERAYEQLSLFANVVPILASGTWRPGPLRAGPGGGTRSASSSTARRGRRAVVAFGPCLVTTRSALAAVGGFDAVRGEVLEDVALAAAYQRSGRPVAMLAGGTTVGFRMYPDGLRHLVEGWTKNLAGGAGRAPLVPTLGATLWVAALAALSVEAVLRPSAWVALAWVAATAQVWWLARRVGTFAWWAAVLFPIPLWAFVALFVRSAWHRLVRRQVQWRGRAVEVGRR